MANTGNVIVTERDTNPFSPTYDTTRTRTYEDLTLCPVEEAYKLKYSIYDDYYKNGKIACTVGTPMVVDENDIRRIQSTPWDGKYNWRIINLSVGSCVTTIAAEAMRLVYPQYLQMLWISPTVNSIGDKAFAGCNDLRSIYVKATIPPVLGTLAFYGSNCPIYVPVASVSAYQAAWPEYASRIQAIPTST